MYYAWVMNDSSNIKPYADRTSCSIMVLSNLANIVTFYVCSLHLAEPKFPYNSFQQIARVCDFIPGTTFQILHFYTASIARLFSIIHQLVLVMFWHLHTELHELTNLFHSVSVTMMSRLMLNLHTAASTGILSAAPTSDTSTGVVFTSRAPDNLLFEMQSTMPTPSIPTGVESNWSSWNRSGAKNTIWHR